MSDPDAVEGGLAGPAAPGGSPEPPRPARSGRLAQAWHFVTDVVTEAQRDRVVGLAAEMAFFAVLALFPAVIAVAALLGFLEPLFGVDVAQSARDEVIDWMRRFLSSRADGTVDAAEQLFDQSSGNLLTVSFLVALVSASRGLDGALKALAVIHGVTEHRSWLRRRLLSFGLLVASVLTVVLTLAMLVLGPLFGLGSDLARVLGFEEGFAEVWRVLRVLLAFAIVTAWAATVLHFGPDRPTRWRYDLPGAAMAAVGWLACSGGLRAYLGIAGSTNQIFGVLGGALIALVWVYLLSVTLLVGAEINAVMEARRQRRGGSRPPSPVGTDPQRSAAPADADRPANPDIVAAP